MACFLILLVAAIALFSLGYQAILSAARKLKYREYPANVVGYSLEKKMCSFVSRDLDDVGKPPTCYRASVIFQFVNFEGETIVCHYTTAQNMVDRKSAEITLWKWHHETPQYSVYWSPLRYNECLASVFPLTQK